MRYLYYWIAFLIIFSGIYINSIFGEVIIEQVIFQLAYIVHDQLVFPINLVQLFIISCIISPIVFTVFIYLIENLLSLVFINLFSAKLYILEYLPRYFLVASLFYFFYIVSIGSYLHNKVMRIFQYQNYVISEDIKIIPKNPKNLVLIYAESIEYTYKNKQIYNVDLLSSMDLLSGVSFKNFYQYPGTGWTIAGMFASQCGEYIGLDFLNYKQTCLSDVLSQHGYYNVYMQGASLDFTHTGEFLKKHKYDELYGRVEWKNRGFIHLNDWGLYDDDLFAQAKIKLKELHNQNKLFNLTILTLDTHAPYGYASNSCKEQGASTYQDVIKCTSNQIADFVKYANDNNYLNDTNIVILGDHLYPLKHKMSAEALNVERTIYNKFISNETSIKTREDINHFDMFPSIIKFLGFEIQGNKLGLGESAF